MSLAAGVRLNNRFTLRELIGTGGMSWVWRADDQVLGRPVAVKVLTGSLATDPTLRSATWTEARAAARLNHPNVTQVYDYGETALPDGSLLPYLVMELVDGENLADRLRYGPLPWQQATAVASQVAAALAAAHRIGVVHRDVKPGNVMLTRSGVKVLDFGIAALAGGPADDGRLLGTPAYAAPERLRPGPATPASDVYALGVLFYEALTGRPPIAAGSWDQAAAAHYGGAQVEPPDAPELPRQLRRLCADCLSPDPRERPTAEELEHGLAAAAGGGHAPDATAVMTAPTTSTVVMSGAAGAYGPPGPGQPTQYGYAAGSAYPPGPPTMVTGGASATAADGAKAWVRRQPRWLLALIGAATAVILVALISLITTSSKPNRLQPLAQPSTPAADSATAAPVEESTSAAPSPSPTTPSPVPVMTTPRSPADQLTAVINYAVSAGRMNGDAANTLREKVAELRASLGRNKGSRKAARELRSTIENLRSNDAIDAQTANSLLTILSPLGGGGGDGEN